MVITSDQLNIII